MTDQAAIIMMGADLTIKFQGPTSFHFARQYDISYDRFIPQSDI